MLDVGSADSVLTSKLAERGLFCIGIEQREQHVEFAQDNIRDKDNVGVVRSKLTPENIGKLPEFDVILLLTVYQHLIANHTYERWGSGYGDKPAEKMLSTLADNADVIIFEIWENPHEPSDLFDMKRFPFNAESISPVEFWKSYFPYVLDDSINVEFLGRTDYKGGERKDILFEIDSSQYDSKDR